MVAVVLFNLQKESKAFNPIEVVDAIFEEPVAILEKPKEWLKASWTVIIITIY